MEKEEFKEEYECIKDIVECVCRNHVTCFSSCTVLEKMREVDDVDSCKECPVNHVVWAFNRGMGYAQRQKIDTMVELANIEGVKSFLDDYKYVVGKYPEAFKSIGDILLIMKRSDAGTFGIDTTEDDSYHRYYTFEKKEDDQVSYLGLWKC